MRISLSLSAALFRLYLSGAHNFSRLSANQKAICPAGSHRTRPSKTINNRELKERATVGGKLVRLFGFYGGRKKKKKIEKEAQRWIGGSSLLFGVFFFFFLEQGNLDAEFLVWYLLDLLGFIDQ